MYNKIYKYIIKTQKLNNNLNIIFKNFYGFKSNTTFILNKNQFEMLRYYLTKKLKKIATYLIKVNCLLPKTKKGVGIRMGKGYGNVNQHLTYIKSNYVFIELFCLNYKQIKYTLKTLSKKLPVNLILVQRLFFFKK